jgi:hypothetical protein
VQLLFPASLSKKPCRETIPTRTGQGIGYALCALLVLGIAVALRFFKLSEWSLWDDEQTSIYFALRPDRPFPSFFPLFFLALHEFFALTNVSVEAARVFSAAIGIGSVFLAYVSYRRLLSPHVALLGALLLAINLGHLFWSQSIRYYTLLLSFQILSMYWFFTGFERDRPVALLLSNLAFLGAMLTHFSALLLAPVYVAYLALIIYRRESGGGYVLRRYIFFGLPFLIILAVFSARILHAQRLVGGFPMYAGAFDPVHLLVTVIAYFGVPVLVLGLLAPAVAYRAPSRTMLFLLMVSVLPLAELAVLAEFRLMGVSWNYAFLSLFGFCGLAATCLVSLYQRQRRLASALLGSATLVYYAVFLAAYYTTMHGDRPRWQDAAAFLRQEANVTATSQTPPVFATLPGVVAYYLGVDPAQIMEHPRVQRLPPHPAPSDLGIEQWYVVEAHVVSGEYASWFAAHCTLEKRFAAQTGPMDRSVLVYHCAP